MDRYLRLGSFLLGLLLFSCAQTGSIGGGQKDVIAPRVINTSPPDLTTNFSSREIEITFDEYIKLNNPQENIIILPSGLKIEPQITKKKLKLTLEGELRPNTTYQITFNSAVKDNTEGNDSLMHYVFSTGPALDSLSYSGFVVDAYTGERLPQILLGLYELNDSLPVKKPVYFCKSDERGEFKFSYVHANQYRVFAVQDVNKDLLYQVGEKVGFRNEILDLNQSVSDSLPLLLFLEKGNAKIASKQLSSPKLLKLGANFPIENASYFFKEKEISRNSIHAYTSDSIAILLPEFPNQQNEVIVKSQSQIDTISFGASSKTPAVSWEVLPTDKDLSIKRESLILFSDSFVEIDTSAIRAWNKDSISVPFTLTSSANKLDFQFPDSCRGSINLNLAAKALRYSNESFNEAIRISYQIRPESNFSSLKIDPKNLPQSAIIECISGKKTVLKIPVSALPASRVLSFLEPGEYHFRVILDENENGKWDPGSLSERKQSERTLHFPNPVKLRANWETEISFGMEP